MTVVNHFFQDLPTQEFHKILTAKWKERMSTYIAIDSRDENFSSLVWCSSLVLIPLLELVPVPLVHQGNEYKRVCGFIQLFHSVINIVNSSHINRLRGRKIKKSIKTIFLIVMPSFQIKITLPTKSDYKRSFVFVLISLLQFVI